jgi:hypothetical protein
MFITSVLTAKKTQRAFITKIPFKKIKVVYYENHMKPINTFWRQTVELLIVKAGGVYSYHWVLKD